MKTWTQIIQNVYKQKSERNWKELYWCIDLHDTIITGTYNKFNDGAVMYPYAKSTLDYLFNHPDHITILWTSSHYTAIADVMQRFELQFNSINCLSTSITDLATIEIAWLTAMIPPEVAPNAVTRAVAACSDLVNSATSPVILPSG